MTGFSTLRFYTTAGKPRTCKITNRHSECPSLHKVSAFQTIGTMFPFSELNPFSLRLGSEIIRLRQMIRLKIHCSRQAIRQIKTHYLP